MSLCPNKSSIEYKKWLTKLGSEEEVYRLFIANNNELPPFTTESELPSVSEKPKFQAAIDDLVQNKNRLNKVLAERKNELKSSSGEKKSILVRVVKALNKQIENIDEQVQSISKLTAVESIIDHANSQLKRVTEILNNPNTSENEMMYARNTINLWKEAGNFDNGHIFFTDEEIEASTNTDSDLSKIRRDFVILGDYAKQLSDSWMKKRERMLNTWLESFGKDYKVSVDDVLKDIGLTKSMLMSINKDDYVLVQAMYDWNAKASFKTSQEATKVFHGLSEVFQKIGKRFKSKELFELFSQTQSNTDNRKTGNLVYRFSQSYFDTKGELWGSLKSKLKWARNNIEDSTKRKAAVSKAWKDFNDGFKKINIVFDVRKLIPDSELYNKAFSNEEIESHKAELIKQLGQKGYEYHLERARKKIEKFKLDREAELLDLELQYQDDPARIQSEIQQWDIENSPYYYAEQWNEGFKQQFGGKFVNPHGYNSEVIPRKYIDGKDSGFYDNKFEKIESDPELYAVYSYLLDTIHEMNSYLPEDIQNELQMNTLPKLQKNILEAFNGGELVNGMKAIWDAFKVAQRENIGSQVEDTSLTDVYGDKIRSLNTYWLQHDDKRVEEYIKRQEVIFLQNNPQYRTPDNKQKIELSRKKKEWKKDILNVIAEENTPDLEKLVKAYSLSAISYKHKAEIEDAMNLAYSFMKDVYKANQNNSGETLKDQFGNIIVDKRKSPESLKKQIEFFMDNFFGDKTQAVELTTKQKLYTDKELQTKKELEDILDKGGLTEKEESDLKEQLNKLGGYRTGGRVLDMLNQYVRMKGLAWNPFAAIINMSIGYVSNTIEGSGGRVFTNEGLIKGYRESLVNSEKTSAIMEKYGILQELQSEIYNSPKYAKSKKWLEPFGLQHKTELLNQSPIMVAVMSNVKVKQGDKEISLYEAFDNKGNLKEGVEVSEDTLFRAIQLTKETIQDVHGNYDKDAPIMANKYVLGRSLLVFRKWMINSFYNRLGGVTPSLSKGMDDKGRWLSYGSYFKEYGVLLGSRDIAIHLLRRLTFAKFFEKRVFGEEKFSFDDKLNEIDAANMRKNLTELMFLMSVSALALLLKATSDDDEDKTKYLAFFWINQLTRIQTDMMFYVDPQQFKSILRDPIPVAVLITDAQKAIGRTINLVSGGEDIYQQGGNKGRSKTGVAWTNLIPLGNLPTRFNNMYQQVFAKNDLLMQAVSNNENK